MTLKRHAARCLMAATLAAAVAYGCNRSSSPREEGIRGSPAILEGGTETPSRLVIGLTPFLTDDAMEREFGPLVQYIGEQLGIPTEVRTANSYAALSQMLASYEVHVAVMSPLTYVQAKRDNPGLILLASQIADGSSTYAAYIVARDDSGMDSLEDLRGKRFGFVDKKSASGFLYPMAYLLSSSVDPSRFFAEQRFLGNHSQLLKAVLKQEVDAGATFSTAFRMAKLEDTEGKHLKILAKTGRIPFDAYCASPRLDQKIINQLRSVLLNLSTRTEEGRRVLRGLTSINGFVAVGDDHYDEVRRVVRLLEESREKLP